MSSTRYNIDIASSLEHPNKEPKLLYISVSKFENDWNSIVHSHHFSELFFVLSGNGNFEIDGNFFPVSASDLIIINPNIEHKEHSTPSDPLEYIVFGIDGLFFSHILETGKTATPNSYYLHNYQEDGSSLPLFIQCMLEEVTNKSCGYENICQNLLEIILTYSSRYQNLKVTADDTPKLNKECATIKRYIDSHYAENITLDFLAKMTHMNKYYIAHAFTKHTGMSPINYLLDRRIYEGKSLLESTNYSIAQIALSLGFSSQSYFSQAFKRLTGMTPNQYRHKSNLT